MDSSNLEGMKQFCLSHVPDADLTLLARGDQEMMLTGVKEGGGPGVMTASSGHSYTKLVRQRRDSPE